MSISNELSCEIAIALLDRKAILNEGSAHQVLFLAHAALRELRAKERTPHVRRFASSSMVKIDAPPTVEP